MFQKSHMQVVDALGVAPICLISDEDLWNDLVTPLAKGLLGEFVRSDPPRLTDKLEGLFAGDEATNFNDHRLYGGQTGFTRNYYLVTFYKYERGAFIVKRDNVKFELFCWFGDVENGRGQLILKAALRDRRHDGTIRANDSPLIDFPYDEALWNKPIAPGLKSVELSIYGFMPDTSILKTLKDPDLELFFRNPYTFVDRPRTFLKHFRRAWATERGPGQHSLPLRDVSKLVMPAFCKLAERAGYDVVELAASHYHVARWAMREGFNCVSANHSLILDAFQSSFEKVEQTLGVTLTRPQQSWLCVVQSLPSKFVPRGLKLKGLRYPQDNIRQECLWLYKSVSEKAKQLLDAPKQTEVTAQNAS